MLYYSTNLKSQHVRFREALIKGLADDGGLFMPQRIPRLDLEAISSMKSLDYPQIAPEGGACLAG